MEVKSFSFKFFSQSCLFPDGFALGNGRTGFRFNGDANEAETEDILVQCYAQLINGPAGTEGTALVCETTFYAHNVWSPCYGGGSSTVVALWSHKPCG